WGQYSTGPYTGAVAAADVDGDRDSDLVVAYLGGVSVLLGDGAGSFTVGNYTRGPDSASTSVAVADFHRDGKLDLAAGEGGPPGSYVGEVPVLLGHGDGTFAYPLTQSLGAGILASREAAADFNGDGLPDLAVTTFDRAGGRLNVLINAGDWAFPATLSI